MKDGKHSRVTWNNQTKHKNLECLRCLLTTDIMWMNHPQHVISRRSHQSTTCEADVWSYKKVLFDESTGQSGSHGSVVSNYGEEMAKKPMESQKLLLQTRKSFEQFCSWLKLSDEWAHFCSGYLCLLHFFISL